MIGLHRDGAIATITIDRQERRNALNGELCASLTDCLTNLDSPLAVIITGAGTAFCAGADLVTRFGAGDGEGGATDTFRPSFEILLDAIAEFPAPVIAAINGPAIGAGMQLAVACDLRIAAPDAKLAIPGGRLGILLSPANIQRLAQLVGHGLARDFLLTGRQVTGREALQLGLVQRIDEDALGAAQLLAEHIATLAPLTVQGHKRALNLVTTASGLCADESQEIAEMEREAFASDDLAEGMAAFSEKRDPVFYGR